MGISLNPYLNFPGNAAEAMAYYQGIFGGQVSISTFGEFGMEGVPPNGTMHAELTHPLFTIMASDALPGAELTWGGTRNYICFVGDDVEVLEGWYQALAEDGNAGDPLEKQVWGDMYGTVMDRYGVEWMFNISLPEGWSHS